MTTEEDYTPLRFRQTRSFRGCISDGWKIFALNAKTYLKYLWAHALLAGLGFALSLFLLTRFYVAHFLPARLYAEAGMDHEMVRQLCKPAATDCLPPALGLLFAVIATYLAKGAGWTQIRFYAATNALPACHPFGLWRETRAAAGRNLLFDALTALAYALPAAGVALVAWKATTPAWAWFLLLLIPIYIYVWVVSTIGRQYYIFGQTGLKAALRAATRNGVRSFGGYLLILMLTAVPFLLVSAVFLLPATLFPLSVMADGQSVLTNNDSGLPEYHSALFIGVSTLAFTACILLMSVRRWALSLKAAADRTQQERMSGREKE